MSEVFRELVVAAKRAFQGGFEAGIGCIVEHIAVALVQRSVRMILVKHRVR